MVPGNLEATTHSTSQHGYLIYIVGNNLFQNVLLADHIEIHSKWKCTIVDKITTLLSLQKSGGTNLTAVLTDSFVLSDTNLIAALLTELKQLPPEWSLTLFNLNRQTSVEKKALQQGIKGFFYQEDSADTLLKGLAAVISGEIWLSRQMIAEIILDNSFEHKRNHPYNQTVTNDLTKREVQILALLNQGSSNNGISDNLCISPHTVRTHLNHIFKKIKVASRLEASVWAARNLFIQNNSTIR